MDSREPSRPRVLIVDDRPRNLLAFEAVIESLDVEIVKAESGDAALGHLLRGDFAVILLDVQMPGLNGLETTELIKKREHSRHIPIILISASSILVAFVTIPLITIVATLLYLDARIRTEGFDLQLVAARLEGEAA